MNDSLVTCYSPVFLVLGYATAYEFPNEDICVGTGVNRKIPLNVCKMEQLLNNDESEQSESDPQESLQERHLQEDPKVESPPFFFLDEFENATMQVYGELDMNITQPIHYYYVKYGCVKGNQTKTVSPVASPTLIPSLTPTLILTISPSVIPSELPTIAPSIAPSAAPSNTPSIIPSITPSATPSLTPSATPSVAPSYLRSYSPTIEETFEPTEVPTEEPTVSLTNEPTLRAGETRAPIRTPTARPSASPSFQVFPVISFASSRSMSLDAKSTSAVTTNSSDGDALRQAMCATQLKSQGLGSDATCSLKGRVEPQKQSVSFLASLFRLSKGPQDGDLVSNHFRGEATDTAVIIDFNSQVNMVNHQGTSLSDLLDKIVTSSESFSPKNFTQTLKKQAKAAGVTVAVTGVGSSVVSKNSVVVATPPTFSPTATPSTATPTIASPTRTPSAAARRSNSKEDGLSVGAIISIAIGGAIFIVVIAGVIYLQTRKLKVYVES